MMRFLVPALLCSLQCAAVQPDGSSTAATLGGPVLGYVHDSVSGGIRTLRGIPGAAFLDPATGGPWQLAEPAPGRNYLIAVPAGGGAAWLLHAGDSGIAAEPVGGATAGADRVVWSADGRAALLLHSDSGVAEVVLGLPDKAEVARRVEIAAADAAAMAISGDGERILAAGADGRVMQLFADGGKTAVPVTGVGIVAFRPGSYDALLVSAADRRAWIVSGSGGDPAFQEIDGEGALDTAVSALFSGDGKFFYVANSAGSLVRFDIAGGTRTVRPCGCVPGAMKKLSGSAFLIEPAGGGPLRMLDTSRDEMSVLFVPAPVTGEGGLQ